jgi:hypothetical protein
MNMCKVTNAYMVLILAVLPAVLACSGCSALQARGRMASQMPDDAAGAQAIVAAGNAGQLGPQAARDYLVSAGATLCGYYGTATVNPFAYIFADKEILATAAFYNDIGRVALVAAENARRAATTQPASQPTASQPAASQPTPQTATSAPAPASTPASTLSDASAVQSAIREANDIIDLNAARRGQTP